MASTRANSLLFDMGNTRLKAAAVDAGGQWRVESWPFEPEAPWAALADWIAAHAAGIGTAWLSCVTAAARRGALQQVLAESGIALRLAGRPQSDGLLQVAYPRPDRLGVDRWLGMRALRAELAGPFLLAGCGSALTVDVVDADGCHLGGVIAPAPERAMEALRRRARHLPASAAQVNAFCDNTEDAVWSGAVLSAVGLIERLHGEAEQRLGGSVTRVLSGGGAATLLPHLRGSVLLREHAVLQGLAALAATASVA